MKTFRRSMLSLLVLGALGCTKGTVNSNNTAPTDQAADLVTTSLAVNTDGAFNTISDVSVEAQVKVSIDTLCGTVWADSITRKTPTGQVPSYSYTAKYSYTLNCNPNSNTFSGSTTAISSYSGSFTGPNLSSTNSGSSNFTLSGLGKSSTTLGLSGEYKRAGSYQSKTDSGSNSVDVVVTDLVLTKPQHIIKSGTATITVSGMSTKTGSFSFNGVLVFNGGNTATLTLNGTVYTIDLATGIKTRH
ncbi:hypothetical protein SAMN05216490_2726 [Mucilaginibacter mallensis]|uniref:Uncharacterized protein n=1 Tax=Mucilaginibacter mallensis TaxID=652787 RepID=A0A1H1YH19_MUCMA|nr:hypothetical protein [Mucilaginibacter mallensis]SDT20316.1 hypothetical protein SAMN05216490_2726 [Mucilaginibacter mallensis]